MKRKGFVQVCSAPHPKAGRPRHPVAHDSTTHITGTDGFTQPRETVSRETRGSHSFPLDRIRPTNHIPSTTDGPMTRTATSARRNASPAPENLKTSETMIQ